MGNNGGFSQAVSEQLKVMSGSSGVFKDQKVNLAGAGAFSAKDGNPLLL